MTLVNVRCGVRGCLQLLDEVVSAPTSEQGWTEFVYLHVCPKHGGGHGKMANWVASQKRRGRPFNKVQLGRYVQWSQLRPGIEKAWRTGKATDMVSRFDGEAIVVTLKRYAR